MVRRIARHPRTSGGARRDAARGRPLSQSQPRQGPTDLCANAIRARGSGSSLASEGDFARYDADGALDPTFGEDGIVTGAGGALAIQADGKIVTGGGVELRYNSGGTLSRHNADGTLDTTFGVNGVVVDEWADALAIQADGKIVTARAWASVLARYNPDGTLDTTFGGDGTVSTDVFTTGGWANAVAIQVDGKIVAAGGGADCMGGCDWFFALFRFDPDGTFDPTFGWDGAIGAMPNEAYAVAIQADGKLIAAGVSGGGRFALTRRNTDGTPDTTFGGDGSIYTRFARYSSVYALAIQADGRIVAVGGTSRFLASRWKFALARYLAT